MIAKNIQLLIVLRAVIKIIKNSNRHISSRLATNPVPGRSENCAARDLHSDISYSIFILVLPVLVNGYCVKQSYNHTSSTFPFSTRELQDIYYYSTSLLPTAVWQVGEGYDLYSCRDQYLLKCFIHDSAGSVVSMLQHIYHVNCLDSSSQYRRIYVSFRKFKCFEIAQNCLGKGYDLVGEDTVSITNKYQVRRRNSII